MNMTFQVYVAKSAEIITIFLSFIHFYIMNLSILFVESYLHKKRRNPFLFLFHEKNRQNVICRLQRECLIIFWEKYLNFSLLRKCFHFFLKRAWPFLSSKSVVNPPPIFPFLLFGCSTLLLSFPCHSKRRRWSALEGGHWCHVWCPWIEGKKEPWVQYVWLVSSWRMRSCLFSFMEVQTNWDILLKTNELHKKIHFFL